MPKPSHFLSLYTLSPSGNVTMYAQWKEGYPVIVTTSLDIENVTITGAGIYKVGETVTLTIEVFSPYVIKNLATTADLSDWIFDGDEIHEIIVSFSMPSELVEVIVNVTEE